MAKRTLNQVKKLNKNLTHMGKWFAKPMDTSQLKRETPSQRGAIVPEMLAEY